MVFSWRFRKRLKSRVGIFPPILEGSIFSRAAICLRSFKDGTFVHLIKRTLPSQRLPTLSHLEALAI